MNELPLKNKLNNLSNIRDYFDGSNDINHYYIDVERKLTKITNDAKRFF